QLSDLGERGIPCHRGRRLRHDLTHRDPVDVGVAAPPRLPGSPSGRRTRRPRVAPSGPPRRTITTSPAGHPPRLRMRVAALVVPPPSGRPDRPRPSPRIEIIASHENLHSAGFRTVREVQGRCLRSRPVGGAPLPSRQETWRAARSVARRVVTGFRSPEALRPPMPDVPSSNTPGLPARWAQLLVGLAGFGLAIPLMMQCGLGLGPWGAFHVGLNRLTGIRVGCASILVGVVIVAGSYLLKIRPGPGTIANMVLIGVFIDLILPRVPPAGNWLVGLGYYAVAVPLAGLGTGMYMGARLGNGPRDGLMLGRSIARGWPIHRVRTAIELSALLGGWAMG